MNTIQPTTKALVETIAVEVSERHGDAALEQFSRHLVRVAVRGLISTGELQHPKPEVLR